MSDRVFIISPEPREVAMGSLVLRAHLQTSPDLNRKSHSSGSRNAKNTRKPKISKLSHDLFTLPKDGFLLPLNDYSNSSNTASVLVRNK